jgi:hypothetical protein
MIARLKIHMASMDIQILKPYIVGLVRTSWDRLKISQSGARWRRKKEKREGGFIYLEKHAKHHTV